MLNKDGNDDTTRVNNNCVENNFKIDKHTVLDGKENMPREISAKFKSRIKTVSFKYDFRSNNCLNELTPISMLEDEWFDKNKTKKNKRSYYSKVNINKIKQNTNTKKSKTAQKRRRSKRSVNKLTQDLKKMSIDLTSGQSANEASDSDEVFEENSVINEPNKPSEPKK